MAVRQGGWAPGLAGSYFGPYPLVFPTPAVTPHGGAAQSTEAARPPRQATEPSGCFSLLSSAPVTRPLGNFRDPCLMVPCVHLVPMSYGTLCALGPHVLWYPVRTWSPCLMVPCAHLVPMPYGTLCALGPHVSWYPVRTY